MWFGTKLTFWFHQSLAQAPSSDEYVYEERIYILDAPNEEIMFDLIEEEGWAYAERQNCWFCLNMHSFRMFDEPIEFGEVYSLMRSSELSTEAYLREFFQPPREARPTVFAPGQWFGAKMIFEFDHDVIPTETLYEERVVLVQSALWEEALEIARVEAEFYAREENCDFSGYLDLSPLQTPSPQHLDAIYTSTRRSRMLPDEYEARYVSTGAERNRRVPSDEEE